MPAKVVTSFNFKEEEIARIYELRQALRTVSSGFIQSVLPVRK